MKHIITFLLLFVAADSFAQQNKFTGTWEGKINVGISLRLVFEFKTDETGKMTGILRSPDQSPTPLPADSTYTSGDSIYLSAKKFNISFSGKLTSDSSIDGSFVQGMPIPLTLHKVASFAETKRPQTPVAPFAYNSRDVEYFSAGKTVKIAGTFTYPAIEPGTNYIKAPTYPTVILIAGSGPHNRDENIMLHKPLAVIADYLTKKGFAVLRVDKRGVGKSTGEYATATSADFATDVEAGIDFLKTLPEADTTKIGLIGHSEGGMIAPMVASKRKDVKYIVLLAGPGVPTRTLMSEQFYAISKAEGNSEEVSKLGSKLYEQAVDIVHHNKDTSVMIKKIIAGINKQYTVNKRLLDSLELGTPEERKKYASSRVKGMMAPWYYYFSAHDPAPYLKKLSCNVLALNGDKDVQVISATNLSGIREALKKSKSKKYEVKELPGLNHLFQTCKKCSADEYGELEETFSPAALQLIGDWLQAQL